MQAIYPAALLSLASIAFVSPVARESYLRSDLLAAAIVGRVLSEDAPELPLPQAVILLHSRGSAVDLVAVADDGGHFQFRGLKPGRYMLEALKPGFLRASYKRDLGSMLPSMIELTDAQVIDLTLRLKRGATLAGTVMVSSARSLTDTTLTLFRIHGDGGDRVLVPVPGQRVVVDDRGDFRFYGLEGDDYLLTAEVPPLAGNARRWETVFYPGVIDLRDAVPIRLAAGEERTSVNIQMQYRAAGAMDGRIILPDGSIPSTAQVLLTPSHADRVLGLGSRSVSAINGHFRIDGLRAGDYKVVVRSSTAANNSLQERTLWATKEVRVGSGVVSVEMRLGPGATLVGSIVGDESQPDLGAQIASGSELRIELTDVGSEALVQGLSSVTGAVDAAGRFSIEAIPPGQFRLDVRSAAHNSDTDWEIDSILVNGQDCYDAALAVGVGSGQLLATVTITRRAPQVTGHLVDQAGRSLSEFIVVLFPVDHTKWVRAARSIKFVRTDADGRFITKGLTAGSYSVGVLAKIDERVSNDLSGVLEDLERFGFRFELAKHEQKAIEFAISDKADRPSKSPAGVSLPVLESSRSYLAQWH